MEAAKKELEKQGEITDLEHYPSGSSTSLWSYCANKGIILRSSKRENCKKRDLKNLSI